MNKMGAEIGVRFLRSETGYTKTNVGDIDRLMEKYDGSTYDDY
jgi:NRPS condensation-like uncharacterized protein